MQWCCRQWWSCWWWWCWSWWCRCWWYQLCFNYLWNSLMTQSVKLNYAKMWHRPNLMTFQIIKLSNSYNSWQDEWWVNTLFREIISGQNMRKIYKARFWGLVCHHSSEHYHRRYLVCLFNQTWWPGFRIPKFYKRMDTSVLEAKNLSL